MSVVPGPAAAAGKLQRWKTKLIDLSFHNPFLNFKHKKNKTIRIVDELPTEVFRLLQLEGVAMSFLSIPEEDGKASRNHDISTHTAEFKTYERDALQGKHTDRQLQTDLTKDKLQKHLLNMQRESQVYIEERGINALYLSLGMIEYYEADNSEISRQAPIVMLPVQLVRDSALTSFKLETTEDDPLINPAIIRLLSIEHKLSLPELPEKYDDFDPQVYFQEVQQRISSKERWRVTNDIYLSFFTFQKYAMYKDIEEYEALYESHPIVQALCNPGSVQVESIPDEVLNADLDQTLIPHQTFHILDADSSQQQAILAVRSGKNLVIKGPPGTGKSQTIANIIADALAEGKSILFVSEKRAALEVVYERLAKKCLHDFCLELHSNKTSKRAVLDEIARVLDLEPYNDHDEDRHLDRLSTLRQELNAYVNELHTPYGVLAITPYQAIGQLSKLEAMPVINATIERLDTIGKQEFENLAYLLDEHRLILTDIQDPNVHPWRGSQVTEITSILTDSLYETILTTREKLERLQRLANTFATEVGASVPERFADIAVLCEVAQTLAASPTTNETVLHNSKWNTLPAEVAELIKVGTEYSSLRTQSLENFTQPLLDLDSQKLFEFIQRYTKYCESPFRVFNKSFWQDRKWLREYFQTTYKPIDNSILLIDLSKVLECRKKYEFIQANDTLARELFGQHWQREKSDWDKLVDFSNWIVRVRKLIIDEAIETKGLSLAASGSLQDEKIDQNIVELHNQLESVRQAVQLLQGLCIFDNTSGISAEPEVEIQTLLNRILELEPNTKGIRLWAQYQKSLKQCQSAPISEFMEKFFQESHPADALIPAFRKLFYRRWLDFAFRRCHKLREFSLSNHEKLVAEFKELDKYSLELGRLRLLHLLKKRYNELIRKDNLKKELTIVQNQIRSRRARVSLRRLFAEVPNAIRVIKPCFMMSPLSVSQFIDPNIYKFDLVLFDEASQVTPEDALCAIVRGKQVVVVGDPKQLAPTSFFSKQYDEDYIDPTEDDVDLYDDLESILDQFNAIYPDQSLRWHYRSRHESLIAFSNNRFYKTLVTFPSTDTQQSEKGLKFQLVNGTYEGKGINTKEAEAVANAVVEHIKTTPYLSLGVATFGTGQKNIILDILEKKRQEDPSIEFFFDRKKADPFFVKNLENVQGDERDVIFLSITYGPDALGRVKNNFGPINSNNGWRRLNVIITRAKMCLKIFSSMTGHQIDPTGATSEGPQLLRDYLLFAEKGTLETAQWGEDVETGSPFEDAVKETLEAYGVRLVPQVGQSGYRIDFGVLDNQFSGRFIAGIECDGSTYHSSATARDRDRLRQQVLEDLGWNIIRIWSTDWYHNKQVQVERVLSLIEECRTKVQTQESEALKRKKLEAFEEEQAIRDAENLQEASTNLNLEPLPEVPKYFLTPIEINGPFESFNLPSSDSLIKATILKVAKCEGPIHLKELAQRVVSHWGASKVGANILRRIEGHITGLSASKDIQYDQGFVWYGEIKLRSREISDYTFNAEFIHPEEYRIAARMLLKHNGPYMTEVLMPEVARLLGFKRTGTKLKDAISSAINGMIESGEVRLVSRGIQLADE